LHDTDRRSLETIGIRYMICHWATNRSDPQNLLSVTLDIPLHHVHMAMSWRREVREAGRRRSFLFYLFFIKSHEFVLLI